MIHTCVFLFRFSPFLFYTEVLEKKRTMNEGTLSNSTSTHSRRRILIISGDESIIREIQQNKNISQCKSMLIEAFDEEVPSTNTVQVRGER